MTRPVFLAHDLTPAPATVCVGENATLGGDEGRHAAHVRRIHEGEEIDIVDGRGLRLTCLVTGADKNSVSVRVQLVTREEAPDCALTLVQALAKGGRDEDAVEICTEIGVSAVLPWAANRSIVQWKGPKALKGRAKWESVARAAAKQSRRAFVPDIYEAKDTRELAQWVSAFNEGGGLVLLCHEDATDGIGSLLSQLQSQSEVPAQMAVIVGPEGGIGEDESALLLEAGARMVSVGQHVLRASTAGAVALTLIQAAAGEY